MQYISTPEEDTSFTGTAAEAATQSARILAINADMLVEMQPSHASSVAAPSSLDGVTTAGGGSSSSSSSDLGPPSVAGCTAASIKQVMCATAASDAKLTTESNGNNVISPSGGVYSSSSSSGSVRQAALASDNTNGRDAQLPLPPVLIAVVVMGSVVLLAMLLAMCLVCFCNHFSGKSSVKSSTAQQQEFPAHLAAAAKAKGAFADACVDVEGVIRSFNPEADEECKPDCA